MKKLICLLAVAFCCFLGCAPAETGDPAPSDNSTSQIQTPAEMEVAARV